MSTRINVSVEKFMKRSEAAQNRYKPGIKGATNINNRLMSMTPLIEPPKIAVMEPVENGEKVVLGLIRGTSDIGDGY